VTLGYFALKSALTPSITDCGALPFISHTVSVPVWLAGFVDELFVLPHAATTTAASTAVTPSHVFLKFICAPSPCLVVNAAPRRRLVVVATTCPCPRLASLAGRRPSARCGFAAEPGRRPGDNGRRGRWSERTRRSALTRRRSSARKGMPACAAAP